MKVFAISDPHLSFASAKPMDVFGCEWEGHWGKICHAWEASVGEEDLVLIPGDISWAMKLSDASADLNAIGGLPGKKVILRGNHDYWWSSVSKLRDILPDRMYAVQNDCLDFEAFSVCGTRGWSCPSSGMGEEDEKIYRREVMRLELSLKASHKSDIVVMMHFPPFNDRLEPTGFTRLIDEYGVKAVVYGHLHDVSCKYAFEGALGCAHYHLVSCDHLGFSPKLIFEV